MCACGHVRVRLQHARAAAQGRQKLGHYAWRPAILGGTPVDGGLVSLGSEEVGDEVDRGVDGFARILVPRRVHCDVCAWGVLVRAERSVLWGDYRVDHLISRGGWEKREKRRGSGGDRTPN